MLRAWGARSATALRRSVARANERVLPRLSARIDRRCFHMARLRAPITTTMPLMGMRCRNYSDFPPHYEVTMPALSPTMTEGNLANWLKKEGDAVSTGDVICEIETDKATLEVESQEDGFIAKILVPAGSQNVTVGTAIAVIAEESSDVSAFSKYASNGSGGNQFEDKSDAIASASKETTLSSGSQESEKAYPPHYPITMPALSPTMTEGTLSQWIKSEGSEVNAGDVLCEIETDKATLEMESPEDGFLAKILRPGGSVNVQVGDVIAVISEEEGDVGAFASYTVEGITSRESSTPSTTDVVDSPPSSPPRTSSGATSLRDHSRLIFPSVEYLIKKHRISIEEFSTVERTGGGGSVTKGDVLRFVAGPRTAQPQASEPKSVPTKAGESRKASNAKEESRFQFTDEEDGHTDIPNSNVRKVIARRLTESKITAPHVYCRGDCTIDRLMDLRKTLQTDMGVKVSLNDFVVRASALALRSVPDVNVVWQGNETVLSPTVDIAVAVATEGGLITPIIKNTDEKGVKAISDELKELATRARANKLKPEEYSGGSFTISNLGMFGVTNFTAVINPPQTCIMAVGTGREVIRMPQFSLEELDGLDPETEEAPPTAETLMAVTLSCDGRAVNEKAADAFIAKLRRLLADPSLLLV